MKIGFTQFSPTLGDSESTLGQIGRFKEQFEQADLLVLPELCNSGYNFISRDQAMESSEELHRSKFVDFLQGICSRHNLHIVSGINERDGDDLFNTAVLVGPEGLVGHYRKLHLFANESRIFKPGNTGLPIFEVNGCMIGMLICFDWIFPEVWRALALKGVDIICHPSNLVLPGLAQSAIPIHSLINRVFIVTANRIGTEGDLTFTGRSLITAPDGTILASGPESSDEATVVDVDPALAREKVLPSGNHVLRDRRPEEYTLLTVPNSN